MQEQATYIFPWKPRENFALGGKVFLCAKKVHQVLAAAGGGEVKSCPNIWGVSLPSIYVWLETSAVQWFHLGTGSALCKASLHSQPGARREHCLPSIVVSPIVRVAVLLQENSHNNMAVRAWPIPDSSSHMAWPIPDSSSHMAWLQGYIYIAGWCLLVAPSPVSFPLLVITYLFLLSLLFFFFSFLLFQ